MSDDVTRSDDAAFVSRQAAALERWWNTVRWLRPRQLYGMTETIPAVLSGKGAS